MSAAQAARRAEPNDEEALAHLAAQVEALRRLQLLTRMRDDALAEVRRLDAGPDACRSAAPLRAAVAPPAAPPRLIRMGEAAKSIARHPDTVRRWAQRYGIGWKVGGDWFVDLDRFAAFLAARRPELASNFEQLPRIA